MVGVSTVLLDGQCLRTVQRYQVAVEARGVNHGVVALDGQWGSRHDGAIDGVLAILAQEDQDVLHVLTLHGGIHRGGDITILGKDV